MDPHLPALNGNVEELGALLKAHAASAACATKSGGMYDTWTPLHAAAYKGHAAAVTLLLQHGARPNATTKKGDTPLRYAASKGHAAAATALLQAKADPSIANGKGDTPLASARCAGSADVVALLEGAGAK